MKNSCTHDNIGLKYDYFFTVEILITYCKDCGKVLKEEHL